MKLDLSKLSKERKKEILQKSPYYINYMDDVELQEMLVEDFIYNASIIDNLNSDIQIELVKEDLGNLDYIKEPCLEVQEYLLNKGEKDILFRMNNLHPDIQIKLLESNIYDLNRMMNLSEKAIEYVIENKIVLVKFITKLPFKYEKYIIDKYKEKYLIDSTKVSEEALIYYLNKGLSPKYIDESNNVVKLFLDKYDLLECEAIINLVNSGIIIDEIADLFIEDKKFKKITMIGKLRK